MNGEARANPGSETAAPQKAVSGAESIAVVDRVYEYSAKDLSDLSRTSPYVPRQRTVSHPPGGALVRFNLGHTHYLTFEQQSAAESLAYGARRVQVVGQSQAVEILARRIEQYLVQQAEADAQISTWSGLRQLDPWGESA
jgi:hypothetical protein